MKDLTAKITALLPEAAEALKAIAYFDELSQHGAGVRSVIRAAAALSGVPADLIDRTGGASVRVTADGRSTTVAEDLDPSWPRAVADGGALEVLLERSSPKEGQLDALVAERALLAATTAIGRGTSAGPRAESVALRVAVDPKATQPLRHQALSRLGLTPQTRVCVIAVRGAAPMIAKTLTEARAKAAAGRAGIGPVVPADQAPRSWKGAWSALTLTAEGTRTDPGDRVVSVADAGSLVWLAEHLSLSGEVPDDVTAIITYAASVPWLLESLHVLSTTESIRDAAAKLGLHHSTVQERSIRASTLLGWDVTDQPGKLRTQLALVLWRISRPVRADPPPA